MLKYDKNGLAVNTESQEWRQLDLIATQKELTNLKDENEVLRSVIRHLERKVDELESENE